MDRLERRRNKVGRVDDEGQPMPDSFDGAPDGVSCQDAVQFTRNNYISMQARYRQHGSELMANWDQSKADLEDLGKILDPHSLRKDDNCQQFGLSEFQKIKTDFAALDKLYEEKLKEVHLKFRELGTLLKNLPPDYCKTDSLPAKGTATGTNCATRGFTRVCK